MAGRKLELASRIAIEHNLPAPVAGKILQAFLDTFIDSLTAEGHIELRDFGTSVYVKANRKGAEIPDPGKSLPSLRE